MYSTTPMRPLSQLLFLGVMLLVLVSVNASRAQSVPKAGEWRGALLREDGRAVPFIFTIKRIKGEWSMVIHNGKEQLVIPRVQISGDSLAFDMPFFECRFRTAIQPDGSLKGMMTKGTTAAPLQMAFIASPGRQPRFTVSEKEAYRISGRWAATFTRPNNTERPAIAEFEQQGEALTGTFLTPSGDYRYLDGAVSGDSLYLSAFDGSHIYLFTAHISDDQTITGGWFYSGSGVKEKWRAQRDEKAALPDLGYTPSVKEDAAPLDFSFPDIDSNQVSFRDTRFQGKAVVIQIMGSWCPNCMDEIRFLNDYYKRNRSRGVEVIALAYEYSTDFQRSRSGLKRFKDRFAVEYPMLITGMRYSDSLKTEKTLPQITPIKVFPTTLYVGKDGRIRKIESGFSGPGTGVHHELYRKEFEATVDSLLRE